MINKKKTPITVALADDHILLRTALAKMINNFGDCCVILEASNGKELFEQIELRGAPDVAILDLNMPVMDGLETAEMLCRISPHTYILMLTMYDAELTIIRLLKAGVKGFLKKDISPAELQLAIHSVYHSGVYYANNTTSKFIVSLETIDPGTTDLRKLVLSEKEMRFLKLSCTELGYKEIAVQMNLNPTQVEKLRSRVFVKLKVESRIALVMLAFRNRIISFDSYRNNKCDY